MAYNYELMSTVFRDNVSGMYFDVPIIICHVLQIDKYLSCTRMYSQTNRYKSGKKIW